MKNQDTGHHACGLGQCSSLQEEAAPLDLPSQREFERMPLAVLVREFGVQLWHGAPSRPVRLQALRPPQM